MPGICGCVGRGASDASAVVGRMADLMRWGRSSQVCVMRAPGAALGQCAIAGSALFSLPCEDADRGVLVVLDGWLLDRAPLEALLPGPVGRDLSDCELLLQAYLGTGMRALSKLKGQFGAAIWDAPERALHLVSDKAASRHLYYYSRGEDFCFSTQMKSFLALPDASLEMDEPAVAEFFSFGYSTGDWTYLKNVRLLLPGTVLTLQNAAVATEVYWKPDTAEGMPAPPFGDCVDALHQRLTTAHARCASRASRIGIGLSGGRDSRLMGGCFVREPRARVRAYGFDVGAKGEAHVSTLVAECLGIPFNEVQVDATHFARLHRACTWLSEGGINTCEFVRLAESAGADVDALAWGFGGDTLSGRPVSPLFYAARNRRELLELNYQVDMAAMIPAPEHVRAFHPDFARRVRGAVREHYEQTFAEHEAEELANIWTLSDFRQRQRRRTLRVMMVTDCVLPNLYPYLDDDVVECMLGQPARYKVHQRTYGMVLTRHFPELAAIRCGEMNLSMRNQLRIMPALELARRLKRYLKKHAPRAIPPRLSAIDIMYADALRNSMRDYAEDCLLSLSERRGLLNRDYVMERFQKHCSGERNAHFTLIKLITLETFLRQMLDGAERPEAG